MYNALLFICDDPVFAERDSSEQDANRFAYYFSKYKRDKHWKCMLDAIISLTIIITDKQLFQQYSSILKYLVLFWSDFERERKRVYFYHNFILMYT